MLRKTESRNSLYMAMEINLLSLNSDGAFLTTMHNLIPHIWKITSTVTKTNNINQIL